MTAPTNVCTEKERAAPLLCNSPRHNTLAGYYALHRFCTYTSNTGYAFDVLRCPSVVFALAPIPHPSAPSTPSWCSLLPWRELAAYSADAWTLLPPLASKSMFYHCKLSLGWWRSTAGVREEGERRMTNPNKLVELHSCISERYLEAVQSGCFRH